MGNKGLEAALTAVEMAALTSGIRRGGGGARRATVARLSDAAGKEQIPPSGRNDKARGRNKKAERLAGSKKSSKQRS
jgi:hypothetical protein